MSTTTKPPDEQRPASAYSGGLSVLAGAWVEITWFDTRRGQDISTYLVQDVDAGLGFIRLLEIHDGHSDCAADPIWHNLGAIQAMMIVKDR